LREAIEADPVGFLGPQHVQRWGANPALLVKLLDAGERLPVHFHPGRAFAREQLGLAFGKTEAWIIVAADAHAVVHLGLKAPVERSTVLQWVAEQDVPAMLAAMHELPVRPGDALFLPAGTLHAIGAGILLVELQEPTDLSVLLEWQRFGVSDGTEHLGLGWERILTALDISGSPVDELVVRDRPEMVRDRPGAIRDRPEAERDPVVELLPGSAAPYFRAQRVTVQGDPVHLERSFAILVVLEGWLTVWSDGGEPLELRGGETALLPYGAGDTTLEGHGTVIRCLPPSPDAGAGPW
jgi:mannose-6-phosphate isomerase